MAQVKWKWEPVVHANDQVMLVPTRELHKNVDLIEGKFSLPAIDRQCLSFPATRLSHGFG